MIAQESGGYHSSPIREGFVESLNTIAVMVTPVWLTFVCFRLPRPQQDVMLCDAASYHTIKLMPLMHACRPADLTERKSPIIILPFWYYCSAMMVWILTLLLLYSENWYDTCIHTPLFLSWSTCIYCPALMYCCINSGHNSSTFWFTS